MRIRTILQRRLATPAAGFIASVVRAGIVMANRFNLVATEVNPAAAVSATQHSARIDQAPAVAASIVLKEALTPQFVAADIDASLRSAAGTTQTAAVEIDASYHAATVNQSPAVSVTLNGVSGAASVAVAAASSIAASLRDAAGVTQAPGVAAVQSLRSIAAEAFAHSPALAISLPPVSGTAGAASNLPAIAQTARISDYKTPETPAFDVLQTTVNLQRLIGASSVTEEANPRTDWANDASATGINNGSSATFAGNTLGARSGKLVLSYPASVSKSALTIIKVELHFYISQAPPLLGAGALTLSYRIGGGADVVLEALTATNQQVDNLTTPRIYNLTTAVGGSWTALDTIKAVVAASTALSNTGTANCDAVELYVEANRTEVN